MRVIDIDDKKNFICHLCSYKTIHKHNLIRHTKSLKHLINEKNKENKENFYCNICNLYSKDKYNFKRHLLSNKHIKKNLLFNSDNDNNNLINNLIKQNDKLMDLLSQKGQFNNNIINSNNNTINLINYYNEHRKDALTMSDFNEMLKPITQGELFMFDDKPYSKSMVNIFENRLNTIPTTKIPLVCYDDKKIGFLINVDGKGWVLDEKNKEMINSVGNVNKGVYECISNLLEDENFMKKHGDKVMSILSKIKIDKKEIEETTLKEISQLNQTKHELMNN